MGKIYSQAQMESILKIFFSQEREDLLTTDSLNMVNGFLDFCRVKDIINNTDYISQIKHLYGPNDEKCNGDANGLFMSASSRFRFKKSIFELFKKYLSNKYEN